MAEDAKHTADKDVEQKSGQNQEQIEKPETVEKKDLEKIEAEDKVDATESETEDNSESAEDVEPKKETEDDSGNTGDTESEKETDAEQPDIEVRVAANKEVETKVNTDEAKEGIPKVTLTVEKLDSSEKEHDQDDKKDDNIEIEIELEQKDQKRSSDFQESVREQIENCKFEIVSSIQDSVHSELRGYTKELRRQDHRRRVGFILRDIIILILAALLGYAVYCLYDAQYFDFMRPPCERDGTCTTQTDSDDETAQAPEIVKDTKWYLDNYGYLYNSLQLNLNADKVSAYYLYSDDHKLSEIQPNYLLGMAYNVLNSNTTYDSANGIVIPSTDLRLAFKSLFGSTEYFAKENFTNGCVDFEYDKASDSFITPAVQCVSNAKREIVEEVHNVYEEGNAMYFITTAAIYDKTENAFYNFDDLFKSVAQNVEKGDLIKYQASLNQYQYRFKKVDDKFYFSDIVKLK